MAQSIDNDETSSGCPGKGCIGFQDRYDQLATDWPQTRASQYGASYHEMIVLYETSSRNNAMDLEDRLIDYYRNNYDTCENRAAGYGGRPGEGWYYVYVVRRF